MDMVLPSILGMLSYIAIEVVYCSVLQMRKVTFCNDFFILIMLIRFVYFDFGNRKLFLLIMKNSVYVFTFDIFLTIRLMGYLIHLLTFNPTTSVLIFFFICFF